MSVSHESAEWWRSLADRCNATLKPRCPRGRVHRAVFEYILNREGRAITLRCYACGALEHILIGLWGGSPFLSPHGSQTVVDMPGLQRLLAEMDTSSFSVDPTRTGRNGDSRRYRGPDASSPGRKLHLPQGPTRPQRGSRSRGNQSP